MLFVIIFFPIIAEGVRVNPLGPTVINDYTNCVSKLIENNFNVPGLVIFANTNNVSTPVARIREDLLKMLHSKLIYAVQVKSPRKQETLVCDEDNINDDATVVHMDQFEAIPIADYFIIVIDRYSDFTRVASRVIRSRSWNPHAIFIILFFHLVSNKQVNVIFIENFLTCMFRHNVINIAVVVPEAGNVRNALVYCWRPYDPPLYCGYYNETAKNRTFIENTCEHGIFKEDSVFKKEVPDNMQGCVLEILAIERQPFASSVDSDPNIEKMFINQMAERFKFKTNYTSINSFRGERNESGDWDGALKELSAKKGYLLLGGIFPDYDVHEDFECSSTYLPDSYTWIVPRATESPKWLALFIIFQNTVWYCTAAVFFVCVISWNILGRLSKETLYHKTFRHCFLNTWIAHVGFCTYSRPVKHSLRIFYVFFNIYCILFLTGYQTKLFDVLTNPAFDEQVDTIEELVKSGTKFGGFEELHELFHNSSDAFDFFLGESWTSVENITKALIDVAVHRNFSLLCSRLELAHLSAIMPELNDKSGEYKYFAFESNMFTVSMEMVALRGFAYMRYFSTMLERIKQSGVNSAVRRYFAQLNSRKRAKLLRALQDDQSDVSPLTMEHLQGGFLALAMGYISGTFVFILELILNTNYVKRKILKFRKRFKLSKRL